MGTGRTTGGIGLGLGREARPTLRLFAGVALMPGLQPLDLVNRDWTDVRPIAFAALVVALALCCLVLLRSGRKQREEAEASRERHARHVDELVHQQELRIRDAMERGAVRERDRADKDIKERLNTVLRTIREGFDHLEARLGAVEARERERGEAIQWRMEEAMMDLRRAGKATVRIMLERFGLPGVLEDLRWALEASGTLRVALKLQDIDQRIPRRDRIGIYHLVHDAVDMSLGHEGVSRLDIRLERGPDGCVLSVESDGGQRSVDPHVSDAGLRRLEERVADMNGSVSSVALPQGGRTVHVEIPLSE